MVKLWSKQFKKSNGSESNYKKSQKKQSIILVINFPILLCRLIFNI